MASIADQFWGRYTDFGITDFEITQYWNERSEWN